MRFQIAIFGLQPSTFCVSLLQLSFDDDNFGRHPGGVQHPSSGGQHPIQSQEHVSTVVIVPALHNDRQIQILSGQGVALRSEHDSCSRGATRFQTDRICLKSSRFAIPG